MRRSDSMYPDRSNYLTSATVVLAMATSINFCYVHQIMSDEAARPSVYAGHEIQLVDRLAVSRKGDL